MDTLDRPLIVGVGGTTRPGSSTERVLRQVLARAADGGAATLLFGGPDLDLPLYRPDPEDRPPAVRRLVAGLRAADAVVLASPAYHGAVSGLLKNALDYAEDLASDNRPYLDGRAVGCVAVAAGWQAPAATLAQLRSICHALRAWPTPLGVAVNTGHAVPTHHLDTMAAQLLWFATRHRVPTPAPTWL